MKQLIPKQKKIFIILGAFVFFLTIMLGVKIPSSNKTKEIKNLNPKFIFTSIENIYKNNVPWENLNDKISYQFYTKEINGLPVANDKVYVGRDNNYNPLTVFKLTDSISVPLKNTYLAYYNIPDVLRSKFKLDSMGIAMPIKIRVYEFDRGLSQNEKSIIANGTNFKCTNEKSKTEIASFANDKISIYYCNFNLTPDQKAQVKNKGFFDNTYEIYFVNRNILIQFGVDSNYIDNSQEYLSDYLLKIFNSNNDLFIKQNQILSIESQRAFEELRHKTFDNK